MNRSALPSLLIAVFALAAVTAALIAVVHFTSVQFVLGVGGLAVAIITAAYQYRAAKDRETEARLFGEKQAVYTELIETVMGLFHERKVNPSPDEMQALVRRLQNIRTKMLIWGSSETLRALDQMGQLQSLAVQANPDLGIIWLGELFGAIRRDLGHSDKSGAPLELALGILREPDRSEARARIASATAKHGKLK